MLQIAKPTGLRRGADEYHLLIAQLRQDVDEDVGGRRAAAEGKPGLAAMEEVQPTDEQVYQKEQQQG